ncbi:14086_t:CDS:2, partial [Acaulospora colombiana]
GLFGSIAVGWPIPLVHFLRSPYCVFTSPNLPARAYPEGFQGNKIPLDADAVIRLVEHRLGMEEEDFDD